MVPWQGLACRPSNPKCSLLPHYQLLGVGAANIRLSLHRVCFLILSFCVSVGLSVLELYFSVSPSNLSIFLWVYYFNLLYVIVLAFISFSVYLFSINPFISLSNVFPFLHTNNGAAFTLKEIEEKNRKMKNFAKHFLQRKHFKIVGRESVYCAAVSN